MHSLDRLTVEKETRTGGGKHLVLIVRTVPFSYLFLEPSRWEQLCQSWSHTRFL